ncbi:hypothetical protein N864_16395 [Intrasporangium chromatireducens Q5-1]|uniref:Uncharacterized protein n=1 Tax=Intrasporangium chromatireducens Q5-1 TaxID=584657 RepID=W9GP14_9MICO|nr:hypothetical protein [Intrasporangium chromatireducens]EWT06832.1 hypothetical protein N864_16395 [Intrasporangium chromatireducens Q5-1]
MTTNDLLAKAVQHLSRAAALAADTRASGEALAGQIRLAAGTIPATWAADEKLPSGGDVHGHLEQALACLDEITPLDGPADLPLIAWHVQELLRIAATASAR